MKHCANGLDKRGAAPIMKQAGRAGMPFFFARCFSLFMPLQGALRPRGFRGCGAPLRLGGPAALGRGRGAGGAACGARAGRAKRAARFQRRRALARAAAKAGAPARNGRAQKLKKREEAT